MRFLRHLGISLHGVQRMVMHSLEKESTYALIMVVLLLTDNISRKGNNEIKMELQD